MLRSCWDYSCTWYHGFNQNGLSSVSVSHVVVAATAAGVIIKQLGPRRCGVYNQYG